MRSRFLLALLLFPMVPVAALAEDVEVKSALTGVTVFPSGAEVVREAELELKQGDHVIVVRDLPERLVDSSLRIEGEADGGLEIGAVDSKKLFIETGTGAGMLSETEREKLEKEIETLQDEKALLAARTEAARTQRRLMERLTDLPATQPPAVRLAEGDAARYSDESWGRLFDLIGARMGVADELINKLGAEMREKDKEIEKVQKHLDEEPPKQELRTEVRVAVNAKAGLKGKLKLKYQVQEASWRPFYDARLATGGKGQATQLRLERRAGIRQWSGEDWTDVKLALSTTSPQKGAEVPVLEPDEVDLAPLEPPAPKPLAMPQMKSFSAARRAMAPTEQDAAGVMAEAAPEAAMAPPPPAPATEAAAAVQQFAFQAVFDIPGVVSVPTTGDEKKVAVSTDAITPKLKLQTVPKLNDNAYLYAEFEHDTKAVPLLPGEVALYRDGTYTGTGSLPHVIAGGDKFALGFGADEAVKVKHFEVKRQKGETGLITTSQVDERRYGIEVTNLHDMPVDMVVIDQIPYSVNEQVVVKLLPTATKPSRENVEERRGILAWDFPLKAGEKRTLNLDYTIAWPAGRDITSR